MGLNSSSVVHELDETKWIFAIEVEVGSKNQDIEICKEILPKYLQYDTSASSFIDWKYRRKHESNSIIEYNTHSSSYQLKHNLYTELWDKLETMRRAPIWSDWLASWGVHCHLFFKDQDFVPSKFINGKNHRKLQRIFLQFPFRTKIFNGKIFMRNRAGLSYLLQQEETMPSSKWSYPISYRASRKSIEFRHNNIINPIIVPIYCFILDYLLGNTYCWYSAVTDWMAAYVLTGCENYKSNIISNNNKRNFYTNRDWMTITPHNACSIEDSLRVLVPYIEYFEEKFQVKYTIEWTRWDEYYKNNIKKHTPISKPKKVLVTNTTTDVNNTSSLNWARDDCPRCQYSPDVPL